MKEEPEDDQDPIDDDESDLKSFEEMTISEVVANTNENTKLLYRRLKSR